MAVAQANAPVTALHDELTRVGLRKRASDADGHALRDGGNERLATTGFLDGEAAEVTNDPHVGAASGDALAHHAPVIEVVVEDCVLDVPVAGGSVGVPVAGGVGVVVAGTPALAVLVLRPVRETRFTTFQFASSA